MQEPVAFAIKSCVMHLNTALFRLNTSWNKICELFRSATNVLDFSLFFTIN